MDLKDTLLRLEVRCQELERKCADFEQRFADTGAMIGTFTERLDMDYLRRDLVAAMRQLKAEQRQTALEWFRQKTGHAWRGDLDEVATTMVHEAIMEERGDVIAWLSTARPVVFGSKHSVIAIETAVQCKNAEILSILSENIDSAEAVDAATKAGSIVALRWLNEQGFDIQRQSANAWSLLGLSLRANKFEIVKWMVNELGVDLKRVRIENRSLVDWAIDEDYHGAAEFLQTEFGLTSKKIE